MKSLRMPGKYLLETALVGGSVAVALASGEMLIRILDLPPKMLPSLNVGGYVPSDNPILKYVYRPGYDASDVPFDDQHRNFSFNAAGFRDYEFEQEKPAGVERLVILGDSTTAGNGVPDVTKTYPKVLEKLLNELERGKYQVYNMAVGGYHTLQEVELLRTEGIRYQPDLVIIGFCLNDFSYDADGQVSNRLRAMHEARDRGPLRTAAEWLISRSRLFFVLYHRIRAAVQDRLPMSAFEAELRKRDPVDRGFELLSRLQKQHGFAVLFFILPGFDEPFERYAHASIHARVRTIAARYPNIAVVDLLEDLKNANLDARSLALDELHPNEAGHDAIARALLHRIRGF